MELNIPIKETTRQQLETTIERVGQQLATLELHAKKENNLGRPYRKRLSMILFNCNLELHRRDLIDLTEHKTTLESQIKEQIPRKYRSPECKVSLDCLNAELKEVKTKIKNKAKVIKSKERDDRAA